MPCLKIVSLQTEGTVGCRPEQQCAKTQEKTRKKHSCQPQPAPENQDDHHGTSILVSQESEGSPSILENSEQKNCLQCHVQDLELEGLQVLSETSFE